MDAKKILVIGLGRIGLPQALVFAEQGFQVYGYARNTRMLDNLAAHKLPFEEPGLSELLQQHYGKNFIPYTNWDKIQALLPSIDGIFFSIGTQVMSKDDIEQGLALDLSDYYVLFDQIFSQKQRLKRPIPCILRTTVPLGTTEHFKNYLEKTHACKEGVDFYLAFMPERMTEGCAIQELQTLPRIVGAFSDEAFVAIERLMKQPGCPVIRVANPLTAEFCKLTDNSYRSTIFAYANELAMYANSWNISVSEVIQAVNQQYQRNHIPSPGFVSGYCLTKDPYIFEMNFLKKQPERDFHSVWYYARRTNDFLINFVMQKINDFVQNRQNITVAILGLSFKTDVDDFRLSHSFNIMDQLISSHPRTQFKLYDPNFDKNEYTRLLQHYGPCIVHASRRLQPSVLEGADVVLILTPHKAIKRKNISEHLEKLLKKTKQPCYLLDLYQIWDQAAQIKHIKYANFEGEF